MPKLGTKDEHDPKVTQDCERVLVTLVRGLGPWKESIYLVGGLTPRYLVKGKPPNVPEHAGTTDVDVVVELQVLAATDAYKTLEENFKKMGFERGENADGKKQTWRWQTTEKTESGARIVVELLADDPEKSGGKVAPLPTDGNVSALNIPHASMVFDHHEIMEVTAELLGERGKATEKIRHADIVSFTCLKALALDQRYERKDAHDLLYCLEHREGGPEAAGKAMLEARQGKHAAIIDKVRAILATRFTDDEKGEGYRKDGPVAVAQFELGTDDALREARLLRQRNVTDLVTRFLKASEPAK